MPTHVPVPVLNFQDFISADSGLLTTTSRKVTRLFGKDHPNVCTQIEALVAELGPGHAGYFGYVGHMPIATEMVQGATGQDAADISMTRDGFALLVMGFTDKKAFAFTVAYFSAFGAKAAFMKNQAEGLRFPRDPKTQEFNISRSLGSNSGPGLGERCLAPLAPDSELAALKDEEAPSCGHQDAPPTVH